MECAIVYHDSWFACMSRLNIMCSIKILCVIRIVDFASKLSLDICLRVLRIFTVSVSVPSVDDHEQQSDHHHQSHVGEELRH